MRSSENIEKLVKKLRYQSSEKRRKRIFDNVTAILDGKQKRKQAVIMPNIWRIIMTSKITKSAAAAIVIIGISALFLFPRNPSSIALADVYAKVQQAQAFMYKMSMTMTGSMMEGMPAQNMEMDTTVIISAKYGMKMENKVHLIDQNKTTTQEIYFVPNEGAMIQVMPEEKKYMRMEFSEDLIQRIREESQDPREMIKQMLDSEYTDLGFSEIDGIKVQGFQSDDPAHTGGVTDESTITLWIDIDTWLPIQSDLSMKSGPDGQMKGIIKNFQWNIDVNPDEFVPVIPEGYEEMGSIKIPEMNEDAVIVGLKKFVELTEQYPENLNVINLIQEASKAWQSKTNIKEKIKNQEITDQEFMQQIQNEVMPMQGLGMFYMTLVQDKKDPAYYGNQLTPDDVDAVLMRWKLDNGKYKVVFGDLSTVEMEYEDMITIEPESLQETPQAEPDRETPAPVRIPLEQTTSAELITQ